MTTVGYARVSTDHQNLAAQSDALEAVGCERVVTDQLSGVAAERPGLAGLLDYVRAGDTVVVVALDRLGRSLSGVIATIETLTVAGVLLRSLREGIDYSTATGKMLAGIFAALAGYERELMHERAAAARAAARARGKHTGRSPRLSEDQVRQVRSLREGGESITSLMASFTASRATIYRALQQAVDGDVVNGERSAERRRAADTRAGTATDAAVGEVCRAARARSLSSRPFFHRRRRASSLSCGWAATPASLAARSSMARRTGLVVSLYSTALPAQTSGPTSSCSSNVLSPRCAVNLRTGVSSGASKASRY